MADSPNPIEPTDPIKRELAAKAVGTKQKIVAAALREFAKHGKEGARVDRIARAARVNKAMIYYHFDSKDRLYREVLVGFYRNIAERAQATVIKTETLQDALLALATLHAESVLGSEEITPLVLREMADPDPEVMIAITEVFASAGIPAQIKTLLQENLADGSIREHDIRHAMVSFISMSLGYMAIAPLANRIFNITDQREFIRNRPSIMVDIFLNGLKAK